MKVRNILSLLILFITSLTLVFSVTIFFPSHIAAYPLQANTLTQRINLGFCAWAGWFPWQVSQAQNLFSANKINVKLKYFDDYQESINALKSGQLDANSQTLSDTIKAVASGSNQVIVLVNDNSYGGDSIIVREGINSMADLKGKIVAIEKGSADHFLLLLALKKAGLSAKDIKFKFLETGTAVVAFSDGKVDAVGAFAPFNFIALSRRPGSKELFSSKNFPGAIPDVLVVSRKLINKNPQSITSIINTWFKTGDFIKQNPDKAYPIMATRAELPIEEYKTYESTAKFFTLEDNLKAFTPSNNMTSLYYAARETSKLFLEAGIIQRAPDLSKLFDDRFIKVVKSK
jgi:NitT/TauT family transport system substrate-binding protein